TETGRVASRLHKTRHSSHDREHRTAAFARQGAVDDFIAFPPISLQGEIVLTSGAGKETEEALFHDVTVGECEAARTSTIRAAVLPSHKGGGSVLRMGAPRASRAAATI